MSNPKDLTKLLNQRKQQSFNAKQGLALPAHLQKQQKPAIFFRIILAPPLNNENLIRIQIDKPPTQIILIKNLEKLYAFSHIEVDAEGPICVYRETASMAFDVGLPEAQNSTAPEGAANESN